MLAEELAFPENTERVLKELAPREWVYFASRIQKEGLLTTIHTFSRADLETGGLGDMFDNLIADLIGERSAREALSRGM